MAMSSKMRIDGVKMFNKYKPGEAIVRFRGDMESKNTVMRDPVLFRINDARHPRLGRKIQSLAKL